MLLLALECTAINMYKCWPPAVIRCCKIVYIAKTLRKQPKNKTEPTGRERFFSFWIFPAKILRNLCFVRVRSGNFPKLFSILWIHDLFSFFSSENFVTHLLPPTLLIVFAQQNRSNVVSTYLSLMQYTRFHLLYCFTHFGTTFLIFRCYCCCYCFDTRPNHHLLFTLI